MREFLTILPKNGMSGILLANINVLEKTSDFKKAKANINHKYPMINRQRKEYLQKKCVKESKGNFYWTPAQIRAHREPEHTRLIDPYNARHYPENNNEQVGPNYYLQPTEPNWQ
jgi:hypothetical protein